MANASTQFQVGHEKMGGRKPGTPNKKTTDLQAQLDENGIDPVAHLGTLLPALDATKQVDVCLRLMDFLFPRRKPADLPLEPERRDLSIEEQRAMLAELRELNEVWRKK